jgi:hypothetical protein
MLTNNRKLQVFLCHSSVDKPIVSELYSKLHSENWVTPWLDTAKILPGEHWTTVIKKAIDTADVVIIFISNNSINREGFVQREMNFAWEKSLEKPKNTIFLIPLRLEDCEVPYDFREKQWVDYFGRKKLATYQALLEALKVRYEQVLKREENEVGNSSVIIPIENQPETPPEIFITNTTTSNTNKKKLSPPNFFHGVFLTVLPGISAIILAALGFGLMLVGPNIGVKSMVFALLTVPLLSVFTMMISGIGVFLAIIRLLIYKKLLTFGELITSLLLFLVIFGYQIYIWNNGDALIASLGYR